MITTQCDSRTKANCSRVSRDWYHGVVWTDEEQRKRFIQASGLGNEALVKELIGKRMFDDVEASGFREAIAAAVKGGHYSIADMLLDRFHKDRRLLPPEIIQMITAKCDSRTKANCSTVSRHWNRNIGWNLVERQKRLTQAIMAAATAGRTSELKSLLDLSLKIMPYRLELIESARIAAIKGGHIDTLSLLLADPVQYFDSMPLYYAATSGNPHIVKLLLSVREIKGFDDALLVASEKGFADVVKLLLVDGRANPKYRDTHNSYYNTNPAYRSSKPHYVYDSLQIASQNGHTDVVNLLLRDGRADPTARKYRAIILAHDKHQYPTLERLLLDSRIDPIIKLNMGLIIASFYGQADRVRSLLADSRTNPSTGHNEALRHAIDRGHSSVVQLLSEDGRLDKDGRKMIDGPGDSEWSDSDDDFLI